MTVMVIVIKLSTAEVPPRWSTAGDPPGLTAPWPVPHIQRLPGDPPRQTGG